MFIFCEVVSSNARWHSYRKILQRMEEMFKSDSVADLASSF